MTVTLPHRAPFTVEDLDAFPEDGNRYELIEGDLHVSAAPTDRHGRIQTNLTFLLGQACPDGLELLTGPAVKMGPTTMLIPDLAVVALDGAGERQVEQPPLLVVEILSPSIRHYDIGTKRPLYRERGVAAVWIVDPTVPSVTEWREDLERTVTGDELARFDWPFPVTLVPVRLTEPGGWRHPD